MRIRGGWTVGLFGCLQLIGQVTQAPYSLTVAVNEVTVSFHASDDHRLPVNDLKLTDLRILDNGVPPVRISNFQARRNIPIRVGILFDTSTSMTLVIDHNREVALQYTQGVLRQSTDQAFITSFASTSQVIQPWTNEAKTLAARMRRISGYGERTKPGTAIYDTLSQTCRSQFDGADQALTSNFILLFSDGDDNASRSTLAKTVEACQHNHVALYPFRTGSAAGAAVLGELAEKTGGRVFHYPHDTEASRSEVDEDLRSIEDAQRSQYQLVYVPSQMRRDGTFHHVQVTATDLQDHIEIRSGYYAPTR